MNATGQIAGDYRAEGGFTLPFYWDPIGTGTAGVNITALPSGSTASGEAIGNNGEIVGTGETACGQVAAFHSLMGATPSDDGTLSCGSNSSAGGIAPSGTTGGSRRERSRWPRGSHSVGEPPLKAVPALGDVAVIPMIPDVLSPSRWPFAPGDCPTQSN
jgi:hypothetical protein